LELARLAREHDFKNEALASASFLQGSAADASGAPGAGLAEMRRGVEELRAHLYFDGLSKIALAGAEARASDPGRAIAILEDAMGERGRQFEAELFRTRGEILLERTPATPPSPSNRSSSPLRSRDTRKPEASACAPRCRRRSSNARAAGVRRRAPHSAPRSRTSPPAQAMSEFAEARALFEALAAE
jgi:hypothetical protein